MKLHYLKKSISRLINYSGFSLSRLSPSNNPYLQLIQGLDKFKIDLVLDVGANSGQFGESLLNFGYSKKIVSFEPLPDAHSKLIENSSKYINWQVHERCAVGGFNGEIEINVAGNSVSSSILPMLELHKSAAIGSDYVNSEKVPIFKLDTIAPKYIKNIKNPFLKIDTQGYEQQVLDGAKAVLPQVCGILCELSLLPLYEGQVLWRGIIEYLENEGFTLWALQNGFIDPRDGRSLQMDALFFRLN